ncbi:MAG: DinB family protein [Flavobacteriales bacterium]|nr:DinB family protein [Flavobacteriales bacterium]
MIAKPILQDAPPYTHYYINLLDHSNLKSALSFTAELTQDLFGTVKPENETRGYDNGKWSPCELLGHIIDVERILAYRALRFSRNDATELAGFDENEYVAHSSYLSRPLSELIHEFTVVRVSSIILFDAMEEGALDFKAPANKVLYSPRSIGWMMAGHNLHHCHILRDRYF